MEQYSIHSQSKLSSSGSPSTLSAWNPKMDLLALSMNERNTVMVFRAAGNRFQAICEMWKKEVGNLVSLSWRPDGKLLAIALDTHVELWHIEHKQDCPLYKLEIGGVDLQDKIVDAGWVFLDGIRKEEIFPVEEFVIPLLKIPDLSDISIGTAIKDVDLGIYDGFNLLYIVTESYVEIRAFGTFLLFRIPLNNCRKAVMSKEVISILHEGDAGYQISNYSFKELPLVDLFHVAKHASYIRELCDDRGQQILGLIQDTWHGFYQQQFVNVFVQSFSEVAYDEGNYSVKFHSGLTSLLVFGNDINGQTASAWIQSRLSENKLVKLLQSLDMMKKTISIYVMEHLQRYFERIVFRLSELKGLATYKESLEESIGISAELFANLIQQVMQLYKITLQLLERMSKVCKHMTHFIHWLRRLVQEKTETLDPTDQRKYEIPIEIADGSSVGEFLNILNGVWSGSRDTKPTKTTLLFTTKESNSCSVSDPIGPLIDTLQSRLSDITNSLESSFTDIPRALFEYLSPVIDIQTSFAKSVENIQPFLNDENIFWVGVASPNSLQVVGPHGTQQYSVDNSLEFQDFKLYNDSLLCLTKANNPQSILQFPLSNLENEFISEPLIHHCSLDQIHHMNIGQRGLLSLLNTQIIQILDVETPPDDDDSQ